MATPSTEHAVDKFGFRLDGHKANEIESDRELYLESVLNDMLNTRAVKASALKCVDSRY